MHIENVHIHMSSDLLVSALLSTLAATPLAPTKADAAPAPPPTNTVTATSVLPKIGDVWPGIDGVYAGISRGENGTPDAHLVLLNAVPEADVNWPDAVAWADGLGDGARLPTRFESALIYANLQDKVDTGRWHWTATQYSASNAWFQNFHDGSQGGSDKSYEARARAVRRLII